MTLRQRRRESHIRVDRRVVNLLSRSTYENFPRALRELVSNAYDADATRVDITVDIDGDKIVVEDNGNGMTLRQFDYFLTIAGTMRTPRPTPRFSRQRIGQFGVGFLSVFPFADELEVESTVENSDTFLIATIPTKRYLETRESVAEDEVEDVQKVPIEVIEITEPQQRQRHRTSLTLCNLTNLAREYMGPAQRTRGRQNRVSDLPPMDRLRWDLQDTLILNFEPSSPLNDMFQQEAIGMDVYLNGDQLYRNMPRGEVLDWHGTSGHSSGISIDGMKVQYVITSPWAPVIPIEQRGLKIRVDNVGVGPRSTFGLGVLAGALPRLIWLSGEIRIDQGIRPFLALNREGFANTPAMRSIEQYFQERLRSVEGKLTDADTRLKQVEAEMGLHLSGGGRRPMLGIGPKREIVDQTLKELEQRGFSVDRITHNQYTEAGTERSIRLSRSKPGPVSGPTNPPIEIDRQNKTIRVYEDHPDFEDRLQTSFGVVQLTFDDWNPTQIEDPAYRLLGKNRLLVNRSFPLFRGSYGQIFLRIAVNMAFMAGQDPVKQAFSKDVLLRMIQEAQFLK